MAQNANAIRVGMVLDHQNKLWRVMKTQHTMPGKGGAFIQMELRDVRTGTKLNERFRSSEAIETVELDKKDYQYLYGDSDTVTIMDINSYEQETINRDLIGDQAAYLQEGMNIIVESFEGSPIGVELPETVILEIADTGAVVKGQTAVAGYKPAILSNGVRTSVPPFVATGDKIIVKTIDGSYVERAK